MAEATTIQPEDRHNPDAESILDQAPWDNIPLVTTLPEQFWHWHIDDIGGTWSNTTDREGRPRVAKLIVNVECKVLRPIDFDGRMLNIRYTIGTDTDPRAERPATWLTGASPGATNLHRLMDKLSCRSWRDLKNKNFGCFTTNRDYEGMTFSQPQGFEQNFYLIDDTTFTPGTPTPTAPGRSRNRMPSSAAAGQQSVINGSNYSNTIQECTQGCGLKFELPKQENELLTHIAHCNGQMAIPGVV